jgi:hypothetical protein
MHPVGQGWVTDHHDAIHSDADRAQCRVCHGADYRGTVLSRAQANRTLTADLDGGAVQLNLFRGAVIGCYNCHNGPDTSAVNNSPPPAVHSVNTNTLSGQPVSLVLSTGAAPVRIIGQPEHGSVGLSNSIAVYYPDPGFIGTDRFTFAAWNGAKNSNLETGTVAVAAGPFALTAQPRVPASAPAGWPAPFAVTAHPSNAVGAVRYSWDFGDGSELATNQFANHAYADAGSFSWRVISTVRSGSAEASVTNQGTIAITAPERLQLTRAAELATLSWGGFAGDAILEWTPRLGPGAVWSVETNRPVYGGGVVSVSVAKPNGGRCDRLRKL